MMEKMLRPLKNSRSIKLYTFGNPIFRYKKKKKKKKNAHVETIGEKTFSIRLTNRVDIGEFIRETSSFFHIRLALSGFLHHFYIRGQRLDRTFTENIARLPRPR